MAASPGGRTGGGRGSVGGQAGGDAGYVRCSLRCDGVHVLPVTARQANAVRNDGFALLEDTRRRVQQKQNGE